MQSPFSLFLLSVGPSGLSLQMEQSGRGRSANGEAAALATRPDHPYEWYHSLHFRAPYHWLSFFCRPFF